MNNILDTVVNIITQPAILLGLIACLGLILQKKNFSETLTGSIKTFIGFLVLTGGAGIISNSLDPFSKMIEHAFNVQGVVPNNEAVAALAIVEYGSLAALIMLTGMAVNIFLARFTRFKYIFLTGQIMLYISLIVTIVLISVGFKFDLITILIGGIFSGTMQTITPAIQQKYMVKVTGTKDVAMGHSGGIGYALAGLLGEKLGNKANSTENLKIPGNLTFLRDTNVAIATVMGIVYIFAAIMAGNEFVSTLSNGNNFIIYAIIQAGTFAGGVYIVLSGVRLILGEIIPAFKGVSDKLVPNSIPALDCPIVFPFAPNALLIGFFCSFGFGILSMFLMIAMKTIIIVPGIVPHFFCGGTAGIFGNATGGRKGCIIGASLYGILTSFLPLISLNFLGNMSSSSSTFSDLDLLTEAIGLGFVGQHGQIIVVGVSIGFFVLVLLTSFFMNKKEKK